MNIADICYVAGLCHIFASPWSPQETTLVPRHGNKFSSFCCILFTSYLTLIIAPQIQIILISFTCALSLAVAEIRWGVLVFWKAITQFVVNWIGQEWSYLRGGLTTVDRDYGWINNIHHDIGTHVIHHLFPQIPHYNLVQAVHFFIPSKTYFCFISCNSLFSM